jgi:putative peptidoglycan lipid II flippase
MRNNTLTKHAAITGLGTCLSRIIGFTRDMVISHLFGTGMLSDAFYAAFRIPNLFRRVFGEGAFSAAFIPVFSEYLHKKDKKETQNFLNAVFSILLLTLLIVSILGVFFAHFFAKTIAGGFLNEPVKMQLVIDLTRLMFPFIIFVCLAAFLLSVLNTLHSFFVPSFAPAAISLSEIFYVIVITPILISSNQKIKGLVISVVAGGALCFFIQYPNLKSFGWQLNFKINLRHPAIKKILFLMGPSIIGLSADQVNTLVDSRCASSLGQGAVSALYYANRLMQMPLAIFGLAIASASLPILSKAYIKKDMVTFKKYFNDSIRFTNFTLIPASIGFMAIGLPIVKLLFEGGEFNEISSAMTNNALFYYSLGLPAYALVKIFANAFYSFQDTKTPIKVAVITIILHIVLCIILMQPLGIGGLALATTTSSYINFVLLAFYFKKYMKNFELKQIYFSFLKSLIASILSGVTAWGICRSLDRLFIAVFVSIISSLIVFFLASYILKSEELKIIYKIRKNKES